VIGEVKVTENATSCPVTEPSPPVFRLIPPGKTLLFAVKLPRVDVWKFSSPAAESRLRSATSDGELTLVGTFGVENVGGPLVRLTSESLGKTR
jgi:hypothetical protein